DFQCKRDSLAFAWSKRSTQDLCSEWLLHLAYPNPMRQASPTQNFRRYRRWDQNRAPQNIVEQIQSANVLKRNDRTGIGDDYQLNVVQEFDSVSEVPSHPEAP